MNHRSLEKENEYAEQIGFVKPSFERYYELGTISELNDLCVPRILDLKMQGFITNVSNQLKNFILLFKWFFFSLGGSMRPFLVSTGK